MENPQVKIIYNFLTPTQLEYWNVLKGDYSGGIGYRDIVICAQSGNVVDIADILAQTPTDKKPFYIYQTWVDFSESITEE